MGNENLILLIEQQAATKDLKQAIEDLIKQRKEATKALEREISDLTKIYAEKYAPFKAGERAMFKGKEGVIVKVKFSAFWMKFEYTWCQIRKDKTLGQEKRIQAYDSNLITKIEN